MLPFTSVSDCKIVLTKYSNSYDQLTKYDNVSTLSIVDLQIRQISLVNMLYQIIMWQIYGPVNHSPCL